MADRVTVPPQAAIAPSPGLTARLGLGALLALASLGVGAGGLALWRVGLRAHGDAVVTATVLVGTWCLALGLGGLVSAVRLLLGGDAAPVARPPGADGARPPWPGAGPGGAA